MSEWRLKGPSETWSDQLEAYYQDRPVFALLAGLGDEWRPIHEFCERRGVPCILPNTSLPVVAPRGVYSIYYSRGLTVEAEVLVQYLTSLNEGVGRRRIVQVYRESNSGAVAARRFHSALRRRGIGRFDERVVGRTERLTQDFWNRVLRRGAPTLLVLWLHKNDVETLDVPAARSAGVQQVYLAYTLLGEEMPAALKPPGVSFFMTYPYALPSADTPHVYRMRAWLRSRGVRRTHERVQFNTYFAISLADHSLMPLVDDFSKDYFIESIEHVAENETNPGVYPRLSLGPGQRFASKGSFIVNLSNDAQSTIVPVSGWIVPTHN